MTLFGMMLAWAFEFGVLYLVYHFVLSESQGVYFFAAITVGLLVYFIYFFVDIAQYVRLRNREAYLERKFSPANSNFSGSAL